MALKSSEPLKQIARVQESLGSVSSTYTDKVNRRAIEMSKLKGQKKTLKVFRAANSDTWKQENMDFGYGIIPWIPK